MLDESSHIRWDEIGRILFRNVFLLVNGLVLAVIVSLIAFGDIQAGIFLSIVLSINILAGLSQELRAWFTLRKLELLTTPHTVRISADGSQESISLGEIRKGDRIALKNGDQVPCDGTVGDSQNLEVNEGLITGESDSVSKANGETVAAGSIVTAGSAVVTAGAAYRESRIARMTEGVKRYSPSSSPIQRSIAASVQYFGYALVVLLAYALIRASFSHETLIGAVKSIGALTSAVIPQGLVSAATFLFAYGALHLFRRNVLIQEVNATEKLGRIKNLCMDKTGTLTENSIVVESMSVPVGVVEAEARRLAANYIAGSGDASRAIDAIASYVGKGDQTGVIEKTPFSSWRRFGAVRIKSAAEDVTVIAGSPDVISPHLSDEKEKSWIEQLVGKEARQGKHVFCFAIVKGVVIPQSLEGLGLSIVSAFVFKSNLREGIHDTVDFFQKRGVRIRIISGDSLDTTRAVAALAGVLDSEKSITVKEVEAWSEADFDRQVGAYSVFAVISPEQKERLISAFKKDGFTAMIGDGANDALAIKKADLGIAMFDGAPATRRLAAIVLTNNSFAALPGGVELADSIIKNMEIVASIFLNQSFVAVFLFVLLSGFGYAFPFTPLNITLINYFAVGLPWLLVSYWAIRPEKRTIMASSSAFLRKILPFIVWSAVVESVAAGAIFLFSPAPARMLESSAPAIVALIALGFVFFVGAARMYLGTLTSAQKRQIAWLGALSALLTFAAFAFGLSRTFFGLIPVALSTATSYAMLAVLAIGAVVQSIFTMRFFTQRSLKSKR